MRHLLKTALLAWFALPSVAEAAGGISVVATLSDTSVSQGDVVVLSVRAVADANGDIAIQLPRMDGLEVIGQSQSTQMSMSFTSAGQTIRREKLLRVELEAKSPGKKQIPPIVARLGGASAKSKPLSLMVRGEELAPPVAAPGDGDVIPPSSNETDLFIRYRLSQGEAWLGQQILLDLELYALPNLAFELELIPDPPDLDGFWQEVIDRPRTLTPRIERVEGQRYQVLRAWRLAIFPLQAGTRTLERITASFRVGRAGIFGRTQRVRRKTRALELNVKALPSKDKPAGFSPSNVGNYALTAKLDQTRINAGKAAVLQLVLSGTGNIKSARLPALEKLDGFRVFPPTLKEDVNLRPNGVQGTKTAEILLVPASGGIHTVPPFEMPVFDPLAGNYEVLRTKPIALEVVGDVKPPPEEEPLPEAPKAEAPAQRERRPLRYQASIERPETLPWRSSLWWLVLFLGPLMFVGTRIAQAAQARLATSPSAKSAAENESRAKERMDELRAAVDGGNTAEAAAAFVEAFYARAQARLDLNLRGRTSEEVGEALTSAGADTEYTAEVVRALESANYARFASGGAAPPEALANWTELVKRLERLKRGKS